MCSSSLYSFTPVYHYMGFLAVTTYALKWTVAGQYKIKQRKEEEKKAMDYYKAHHAAAGHH
ncbi:unnamed protein product [Choristocarpus tenellus]